MTLAHSARNPARPTHGLPGIRASAGQSSFGRSLMQTRSSSSSMIRPREMLARWLTATDTLPPEQLLTIWTAAAQGILDVLRQYRHRVFLLGARESLNAPRAVSAVCRKAYRCPAGSTADPGQARETECAGGHSGPGLDRVQSAASTPSAEELQASSYPLGDSAQEATATGEISPSAALLELKQFALKLEQTEKKAGELEKQNESASRQLGSLRQEYLDTSHMLLLELREAQKESEYFFDSNALIW